MVTWGTNTVHTFGGAGGVPAPGGFGAPPAPGGFSFGSPSPAPSFSFGSTPGNTPAPPSSGFSFGSPSGAAPAPPSGFSFGSPAGGGGGGLFGNPAPAPGGGGLFGSSSGGGLFGSSGGASSGGLFGPSPGFSGSLLGKPPSTGLFGGAPLGMPTTGMQQQQQQQHPQTQLPAQAALQAHMDASARQEQARIQTALATVHQQYTGTQPATEEKSSHFVSILYNQATPEYQQLQSLHGMWVVGNSDGVPVRRPVAPPRPPQVSERDWEQAVVRNPDHQQYMPVALVGAEALQGRLGSQQERANSVVEQLKDLQECREAIQRRYERVKTQMDTTQQRQIRQRQKLLDMMQRVEVFRCYNNPLQPDEIKAMEKTAELYDKANRLTSSMRALETLAKEKTGAATTRSDSQQAMVVHGQQQPSGISADEGQLKAVLTEHHDELGNLVVMVKQDLRDLDLIQRRLEATTAPRIAVPSYRM